MKANGIYYLSRLAVAAGLDAGTTSFRATRRVIAPQTVPMLRTLYLGPIIEIAKVLNVTPGTLVDEIYAEALKYKGKTSHG